MSSIYQRALGSDFARLHPQIQRRFGFTSADGIAAIGRGVMDEVWRGRFYTLPFLYVGTWRRIMFPEAGRDMPFTIENYAYVDGFGRETVTWIRTFESTPDPPLRRLHGLQRGARLHRRLPRHAPAPGGRHRADASTRQGGLRLRSGEQRFYEGRVAFGFPMFFSGVADVCEWYDDATGRFRIEVDVRNRRWGPLFGYRGSFDVEWRRGGGGAGCRPRSSRSGRSGATDRRTLAGDRPPRQHRAHGRRDGADRVDRAQPARLRDQPGEDRAADDPDQ